MLRIWSMWAIGHGLVQVQYDFGPGQRGDMLTCFLHELRERLEELADAS